MRFRLQDEVEVRQIGHEGWRRVGRVIGVSKNGVTTVTNSLSVSGYLFEYWEVRKV